MTDLNKLLTPLYLNEKEIRKVLEMIFFSYKDFTSGPDKVLEKINFGRAHHRVIYFVGKQKTLTIKELLSIFSIKISTKKEFHYQVQIVLVQKQCQFYFSLSE